MQLLLITVTLLSLLNISIFSHKTEKNELLDRYLHITRKEYTNTQINDLLVSYKDSLSIAENIKSGKEIAYYNLVITKLYYHLGIYNNAIEYGLRSINEFTKLKESRFLVNSYTLVGIMYGELDDYDIAEVYFQKIDSIASLTNNKSVLYHNYINLGIMNMNKDLNKALEYLEKAEKHFKSKGNESFTLVGLLNNKAVVYKRLGEYDKALGILKNTLKTITPDHSYYVSFCSNISTNYLLKKQADSALVYINKALDNPAENLYINNYINSYRILTEAYILKLKPNKSLKYFKLYQQYTDSLVFKKKIENISKLKVIYETDKLLLDVKKQKQRIEKYNTKVRNLSIGLSILILTIIIFFLLYRKLQASYKKIVKESVNAVLTEEENIALLNKIEILENIKKQDKTTSVSNYAIEKGDDIFNRIIQLFKAEKLYTDQEFNLNALAKKLDTNRTYISNIINSKTGGSFVTFINTYRVKEAKKLLIDDENKNLTLDAIGKIAGFSSTSTFNRVFKAETGVTPSFYVKNKS